MPWPFVDEETAPRFPIQRGAPWRGRDIRLVRGNDGLLGVCDRNTGTQLGVMVDRSTAEALLERKPSKLVRASNILAAAALLATAVLVIWHHGRWFEREHGPAHESR